MQNFVKNKYRELIYSYNNSMNDTVLRLLHSSCPPAVETFKLDGEKHVIEYDKKETDDEWCTAWDEEKAMYCSSDELSSHLAGCNHVRDSWLLGEFERMLIDRLLDINVTIAELEGKFEDCPCGFMRSKRTKKCARCLETGEINDNKNEDNKAG